MSGARPLTARDEDLVARFLRERGATVCPAAFAAPCGGTLTDEDRAAHAARESADERAHRAREAGLNNLEIAYYQQNMAHRLSNGSRAKLGLPPRGRLARRAASIPGPQNRLIDWAPEKIATMRRLAAEGHGFSSVAMQQALGASASTILKKAHKLGLENLAPRRRPNKIVNSGAGAPHGDGGTASPCPARDTAMAGPLSGPVEIAGDVGLARRGHHSGAPTPAFSLSSGPS